MEKEDYEAMDNYEQKIEPFILKTPEEKKALIEKSKKIENDPDLKDPGDLIERYKLTKAVKSENLPVNNFSGM